MASQEEPDAAPYVDPVVEFYKTKIDRTVLRENLKLTVQQRLDKLQKSKNDLGAIREVARRRDTIAEVEMLLDSRRNGSLDLHRRRAATSSSSTPPGTPRVFLLGSHAAAPPGNGVDCR